MTDRPAFPAQPGRLAPVRSTGESGVMLGVAAYAIWGLLPLYLKLIAAVPALQVLAHRVLWSAVILIGVVLVLRRGGAIRAAATPRTLAMLTASATLIALNWLVYIWAIQHAHVLDASLGYFINPLVNVALGVALLGERVRRVQGVAIALAVMGVAIMVWANSGAIWVSLALAFSFAGYGLIRKLVGIDALGGLLIETLLLAPPALAVLLVAQAQGTGAFGQSRPIDALLILAGAVTAVPLLMFAAAARRMPYATLGLIQYIAPTLQFSLAVFAFGEALRSTTILAFALIWAGLALYASDGFRAARAAGRMPAG